ncbi:MAG: L,D-transpeptidase [Pseudonocardiales bacterium]|nr:MAG: L,D-transpeptidase [Pseudonocardiales bacterium]
MGGSRALRSTQLNGQRTNGRHRVAIVPGGALALSAALGAYFAAPAFAYTGSLKGTPCTTSARACVDLDDQRAWLAKDGKIIGGPVPISSGGQGKETPLGTFHVLYKDKDHASNEFPLPNGQPAPMPNSVFFEPGGIAFHTGSLRAQSSGCIHLANAAASRFFSHLSVGDGVQVVR